MKYKFLLLMMSVIFAVCSCTRIPSKSINKLTVGMKKKKVVKVMGHPLSSSAEDGVELLKYKDNSIGQCYYVKLAKRKVISYGKLTQTACNAS
ncbi:hypothetical protein [Cysteiniphilum litorale]|uniref:hypothetical protein n=1 Tax=Cysteiniphilum litorale TaxID=2056700 RepID=UPI003F8829E4